MSKLLNGLAAASLLLAAALPAKAQTKVTIGYTSLAEVASTFVAKDKGFFEKQGLDVNLTLISLNSNIPAALVSNSVQIGTITPPVMVQAIDGGVPLLAVASIARFNHKAPAGLAVMSKAGLSMTQPKDFIGKKVGVPGLNATVHVVIARWLVENGIDIGKVTFIEAPFPNHYDLLKAGTLDAVGTSEPMRTRIEKDGIGSTAVGLTGTMPESAPTMVYGMTPEYIAANPKVVAGFRAAIKEADAFIASNPDETRKVLASNLKMPPQLLEMVPLPLSDSNLTVDQIQFWVDVMKKLNMLSGTVDAKKAVAP
jgi:NitT/TauT family transport system substrate-binding protein